MMRLRLLSFCGKGKKQRLDKEREAAQIERDATFRNVIDALKQESLSNPTVLDVREAAERRTADVKFKNIH